MATYGGHSSLEEELCCSICLDIFLRPRSLPCSHSFCHLCLVKCAENNNKNERFCCPICKNDTGANTNGISRAGLWVTKFPVNYDLLILAQKERNEKGKLKITEDYQLEKTENSDVKMNESEIDINGTGIHVKCKTTINEWTKTDKHDQNNTIVSEKCVLKVKEENDKEKRDMNNFETVLLSTSPIDQLNINYEPDCTKKLSNVFASCLRNDECQPASMYCLDCNELMCKTCKRHHLTNKFTTCHKVIEADYSTESEKLENIDLLIKCVNHPECELKYLCTDHDQLCCNECVIVTHRKCYRLESLADCNVSSESLQCLEKFMDTVIKHVECMKLHHSNYRLALYESEKIIKGHLSSFKAELDHAYHIFEENIMSAVKKRRKENIEVVYSQLFNIETVEKGLKTSMQKLDSKTLFGKEKHRYLYLMKRKIEEVVKQNVEVLKTIDRNANFTDITLIGKDDIGDQLIKLLQKKLVLKEFVKTVYPPPPSFEYPIEENASSVGSHSSDTDPNLISFKPQRHRTPKKNRRNRSKLHFDD